MTMAVRPRAGMHRYGEITVAQVCHAALREFRLRTGHPDPGLPWEDLDQESRDFMIGAVMAARAGVRPPGHSDPDQRAAAEMFQFLVTALTPP